MILPPDEKPDEMSLAYAEWGEVSHRWDDAVPVVTIGTAEGAPVAMVVNGPDPDVYSPAWNGWAINPFDRSTFEPKSLSEVADRVEAGEMRRYPNVRAWHEAEVVAADEPG